MEDRPGCAKGRGRGKLAHGIGGIAVPARSGWSARRLPCTTVVASGGSAMTTPPRERPKWRDVLARHAPLLLPAAHDGLTAKLIARAGFPALQVGGFAVE